MKFVCHACSARYYIDDAKVAGKVLQIRCKRCSASITVREPGGPQTLAPQAHRATVASAAVDGPAPIEQDTNAPAEAATEADVAETWFYSINGESFGPYNEDELVERYQRGQIGDETYVWRPGYGEWQPAIEVPVFEAAIERGRPVRSGRGAPRTQQLDAAQVLAAVENAASQNQAAPAASPAPAPAQETAQVQQSAPAPTLRAPTTTEPAQPTILTTDNTTTGAQAVATGPVRRGPPSIPAAALARTGKTGSHAVVPDEVPRPAIAAADMPTLEVATLAAPMRIDLPQPQTDTSDAPSADVSPVSAEGASEPAGSASSSSDATSAEPLADSTGAHAVDVHDAAPVAEAATELPAIAEPAPVLTEAETETAPTEEIASTEQVVAAPAEVDAEEERLARLREDLRATRPRDQRPVEPPPTQPTLRRLQAPALAAPLGARSGTTGSVPAVPAAPLPAPALPIAATTDVAAEHSEAPSAPEEPARAVVEATDDALQVTAPVVEQATAPVIADAPVVEQATAPVIADAPAVEQATAPVSADAAAPVEGTSPDTSSATADVLPGPTEAAAAATTTAETPQPKRETTPKAEPAPESLLPTPEEAGFFTLETPVVATGAVVRIEESPRRRSPAVPTIITLIIILLGIGAFALLRPGSQAPANAPDTGAAPTSDAGSATAATQDAGTELERPRGPLPETVRVAVVRATRFVESAQTAALEAAAAQHSAGAVEGAVSALRFGEEPAVVRSASRTGNGDGSSRQSAAGSAGSTEPATGGGEAGVQRVAIPTTERGTQGIYGQLGTTAAAAVPTIDPSQRGRETASASSGPSADHFNEGLRNAVQSSIQRCHQRQITEEGSMPVQRVQIELTVQPNGRVSDVSVGRELTGTAFDRCLQGHRERWSFGPFAGDAVTLQKTYVLQ